MFDAERELAERSLAEFIRQAWPFVRPADVYQHNWHLDAICEHLEACARGEIRRLIINVPPRHMKSLATSVFWPCWVWARKPMTRWMFASYAQSLSIRDSVDCRRLIEHPWYQARWGKGFQLAGDQNAKLRYDTSERGCRIATSVNGFVTGEGADFCVLDDPLNAQEGASEVVRESANDWLDNSWMSRVTNPKGTCFVVIMQRLHENDVTGHLMAKDAGWEHLCLPARYEGPRSRVSTGWKDPRTNDGELLWPDRFGEKEVAELERDLGSYGASGQLQQRPTPAEGGVLKKAWFKRRWRPTNDPDWIESDGQRFHLSALRRFCTVDLAASIKTSADYTCIETWGMYPGKVPLLFLLDVVRRRMEAPEIEPAIRAQIAKWKPHQVGVETVGFQLALVQQLRRNGIPIRELHPDRDKISRVMAIAPLCEAGQYVLPENASWLGAFETEIFLFPNGDNDDQVDPMAYTWEFMKVPIPQGRPTSPVLRSENPYDQGQTNPYA